MERCQSIYVVAVPQCGGLSIYVCMWWLYHNVEGCQSMYVCGGRTTMWKVVSLCMWKLYHNVEGCRSMYVVAVPQCGGLSVYVCM